MTVINLIDYISANYIFVICNTSELIHKCKELRHAIYCEEKNWEPESTSRIEEDEYDSKSVHYLIVCRSTQKPVATFRLIISNNLPLAKYMNPDNILHPKKVQLNSVCEISRFSIVREHRNMKLLNAFFLLVGFEAAKRGLVGAYMVMEKSLATRMIKSNINVQQISDSFMLNGSRSIYFTSAADALKSISAVVGFELEKLEEIFKPVFEVELSAA